ncbi:MAG TPA: class I tRNA ligase family protein, partial [Cyclobacteriaceae bacterium]|nr:class I tRNA ligase family protein [Cyclobacteriaceae bacterium]
DNQDEKREKIDFALWKKASPYHIMRWPSPWGDGFPGWHIECTVMSTKYLGETFDIHGGGMDLKFPHHECEIAQGTASTGKAPVNYWLHSNMLTVNGQKMSKSLGNSFLPSELFAGTHKLLDKGYGPMAVRFFMLQSHYSSTLDFSNEALQAAEKGFKKLVNALVLIKKMEPAPAHRISEISNEFIRLSKECYLNMSDDFNTAKTLAVLFEMSSRINDIKSGNITWNDVDTDAFTEFKNTYVNFIENVLGLQEEKEQNDETVKGTINLLIDLRKKARTDKNFALSDKIRDDLKKLGIQIKDGKDGEMTYTFE